MPKLRCYHFLGVLCAFMVTAFSWLMLCLNSVPASPEEVSKHTQGDNSIALQNEITRVIERVLPAYVFIGGGSGVIISADGYLLTNYHVVGASRRWLVYRTDGKDYQAEVVGYNPRGDLALLKIKGVDDLPFLRLGDSDKLRVGQTVLAIGNPFGLGIQDLNPSVSLGIISALHRYQAGDLLGRGEYADAIQTDTPINPGNSGGPLINLKGALVGINGRIEGVLPFVRANTGIGYAIPVNQIRKFLPYLKKGGKVSLGQISGLSLSQERVADSGAKVIQVRRGSQAYKLGIKRDDIIIEMAGETIQTCNRFWGILAGLPAGEKVTLKLKRGNELIEVITTLEERD